MGMIRNFFLWCIFFLFTDVLSQVSTDDSDTVAFDDTVTIEAEADPERNSRQIYYPSPILPEYQPILYGSYGLDALKLNPCITSKGILGKCMPFAQCYPYFKLPTLTTWDTWVFGMQDTCSYYTAQGRQLFGVCCTNPQKPTGDTSTETPAVESEDGSESPPVQVDNEKKNNYPSWPPPLPTHSPDNTIPPLPTHPPSAGYPTLPPKPTPGKPSWPPSTSPPAWPPSTTKPDWPPSTTRPSWPPTTSRPTWPPFATQPAWPPSKPSWPQPAPPTQTKPPAHQPPSSSGSCGAKNGYQDQERIVGGHNADVGEWPWIAALFNSGRQFCGGSLIDDMHILSAAHCVAHMSSWDVARLTVRLGDYNIRTNSEVNHIEKKVKRVVRHRGFDSTTLYNDIAILTLDTPVQFTNQIRPICLPSGSSNYAGKTATVIGWGSLRESGPQPSVLQEVNIPVWSNIECRSKYGHAAPGGIVDHMLCAGQANRDSCSGDSGGPLMVNAGKWVQAGIVSWGIGCGKGQYPGVYTRVEKFLPWINKNLK